MSRCKSKRRPLADVVAEVLADAEATKRIAAEIMKPTMLDAAVERLILTERKV